MLFLGFFNFLHSSSRPSKSPEKKIKAMETDGKEEIKII
jgi:hypothetical protein